MAEKHLQKSWKIRFRISCHETVVKKQNLSYHRNRPNICIENYTFGGNGRVEDEEERILPIFIAFFLGLLFPHLIFLPWRMWRHICFPNVNNNVENHRMFWPKSYSILFPEATQNETWEKILKFSVQNHNRTWTHTNFPSKITFQSLFCVNTELMVSHPNSSDGFDENPNQDFFLNSWNWGENGSTLTFMRKITYAHFFSWREARSSDHICSPQILLEKKLIRDVGIFFGKTKTINKMMMPW